MRTHSPIWSGRGMAPHDAFKKKKKKNGKKKNTINRLLGPPPKKEQHTRNSALVFSEKYKKFGRVYV